tara:strand:- start:14903 stop:15658 length:756 start_codon:yes stop_codon:yes gene_type:complete
MFNFFKKLKSKETSSVVTQHQSLSVESKSINEYYPSPESIQAWRGFSLKMVGFATLLLFVVCIQAAALWLAWPLKTTQYVTFGYEVIDGKAKVVDIRPTEQLTKDQYVLLIRYFINDTVEKSLSNYRDEILLKQDLSIASSRMTGDVYKKIASIHREFQKQSHILTRQIRILSSEKDGKFGSWKVTFETIDEDTSGNIYKNIFDGRITFKLLGVNNNPNASIPVELLQENPNPLGLKITGFYQLKRKQGDK